MDSNEGLVRVKSEPQFYRTTNLTAISETGVTPAETQATNESSTPSINELINGDGEQSSSEDHADADIAPPISPTRMLEEGRSAADQPHLARSIDPHVGINGSNKFSVLFSSKSTQEHRRPKRRSVSDLLQRTVTRRGIRRPDDALSYEGGSIYNIRTRREDIDYDVSEGCSAAAFRAPNTKL